MHISSTLIKIVLITSQDIGGLETECKDAMVRSGNMEK